MSRLGKVTTLFGLLALVALAVTYAASISWRSGIGGWASAVWMPPGPGGPVWQTVRFGAQHFAWPAFLFARLGLPHSWILLLAGAVIASRPLYRAVSSQFSRLLAIVLLYAALGWTYFWLLPVPSPWSPYGQVFTQQTDGEVYFAAFVRGYREGVTDTYLNEEIVPEAYTRGKRDGLIAGIGERLRVAPGFMTSGLVEHLRKYPPKAP